MSWKCPHCKKAVHKPIGRINSAKKGGWILYCGRICSGLARRKHRTVEEKKRIKKEYDAQYVILNRATLKVKKKIAFQIDYKANPEKYRKVRQQRMKAHIEYCRKPEYRVKKKVYDHKYKLEKFYGDFWEVASALTRLKQELGSSKQIKLNQGIINKSQKRKRKWDQTQKASYLRRT